MYLKQLFLFINPTKTSVGLTKYNVLRGKKKGQKQKKTKVTNITLKKSKIPIFAKNPKQYRTVVFILNYNFLLC